MAELAKVAAERNAAQAKLNLAQVELDAARALLREVMETADMFKRGMESIGAVTGPNEQIERIRNYLDACDTLGGNSEVGS